MSSPPARLDSSTATVRAGYLPVTARGESVFAAFHPATASAQAPRLAVLLCSPFGAEDLSAHRGWRGLAQQLADVGLPCLRFDWPGQGDSCPLLTEEDQLPAWLQAAHLAIDWLKVNAGVQRVALVGVRLGALLAQQVAAVRADVHALVLLAPLRSGHAYVREFKMLSSTTQTVQGGNSVGPVDVGGGVLKPGFIQAAGFVLNQATVESLRQLAPPKRLAVPWVVVVDRADRPLGRKQLDELVLPDGATRRYAELDGFVQMFITPYLAQAPAAVYERVRDELTEAAQLVPPGAARLDRLDGLHRKTLSLAEGEWVEECVAKPLDAMQLQGVWTSPVKGAERSGQAILILNSSAERRVGPNGMWAGFARSRALRGDVVLRVDYPGIGETDSLVNEQRHVVYPMSAMACIGAALEALMEESPGFRVTLVGLCSGAYHALRAAVEGMPVHQAFMINPLLFRLDEGSEIRFDVQSGQARAIADKAVQRMRDPQRWLKLLKGQVNWRSVMSSVWRSKWERLNAGIKRWARDLKLIEHLPLTKDLQNAIRRKVRLHFYFAATDPGAQLVREQTGRVYERLLRKRVITEEIFVGADHTFTDVQQREALLQHIHHALDQGRPSDSVLSTRWYASAFK